MTGVGVEVPPNSAFLPESSELRRLPRAPSRLRSDGFLSAYEDRALVYDAFWHRDGRTILLVGPPPLNLGPHYARATYRAGETVLAATYHRSLSTMITALRGAPTQTRTIEMDFAGERLSVAVGENHAPFFSDGRMLFTLSKDNDLEWIAEWARWHARLHGTDSVLMFDNGSTRYSLGDITETLLRVDGITRVAVSSWPWRYGKTDTGVKLNPFYALYLQVSSMSVALRRFGAAAKGLLNADVDELFASTSGASIYDAVRQSSKGLIAVRGRFMEPVAVDGAMPNPTHRDFQFSHADPKRAASRPRKWALDPSRSWLESFDVQPYMHWIKGRPLFSRSSPDDFFYRHFRGINTNWKENRTRYRHATNDDLVRDEDFRRLVESNAF